jgi:hypothetical protein
MIDVAGWATAAAGAIGMAGGLLRLHLKQRERVERERSARSAARMSGIARIVHHPHARVRVVERDGDGERVIEIGGRHDAGAAA